MEFAKLKAIIVDVLNVDEDEITMDTTFVDDLGADSLDAYSSTKRSDVARCWPNASFEKRIFSSGMYETIDSGQ